MNRLWAAGMIFIILVSLCFLGNSATSAMTKDMNRILTQLEDSIRSEDAEKASQLCREALETWQDCHQRMASYITHSHLESIDQSLASLPPLVEYEIYDQVLAECQRAQAMISHLKEAEQPSLQNIL